MSDRSPLDYETPPPKPDGWTAERVTVLFLHAVLMVGGAALCLPLVGAASLRISEGARADGGLSILCCAVPAVVGAGLLVRGVRGFNSWLSRGRPPR